MERDSTVRRIRAQQNQHTEPDSRDGAAAVNGFRSRKHKPEVSAQLLRESSAALLLLGFVCVLWVLVLMSVQQLIISRSSGHFNALRASWGQWTGIRWCLSGYLTAFQLRVESSQGRGDDTAANNIVFKCSDGFLLQGDGTSWGDWGDWSPTCQGRGICGISTRLEASQGKGDDTALNDAQMFCCD